MTQPAKPARQWRVLVIDDEEVDRTVIRRAVEGLGHEVATAASGAEGMVIAGGFHPHVILIDINMSRSDGYEVCEQLRGTSVGKIAAIFAMTGFKSLEDLQRAHQVGFDGFLGKPLELQVLARLLR